MHVYPPDEALKSARPLPKREDLVIEDVSDEGVGGVLGGTR